MTAPIPTPGRIVLFTLDEARAKQINAQRTQAGHATKTGNVAREGDVYPMVIVRVWGNTQDSSVNGQLFLDGNDTLWVTSVSREGEYTQGHWAWPIFG